MASTSPATTISGTDFAHATTLFDASSGDTPCAVYTVHNRDATIYVRVVVPGLHKSSDGGYPVPPGTSVPFRLGPPNGNGITKVQVWAESGSPVIDGGVEARA